MWYHTMQAEGKAPVAETVETPAPAAAEVPATEAATEAVEAKVRHPLFRLPLYVRLMC